MFLSLLELFSLDNIICVHQNNILNCLFGLFSRVFPAEACETVGGEACLADIYPEAKLLPQQRNDPPRIASENVEREYLEYNDAKT